MISDRVRQPSSAHFTRAGMWLMLSSWAGLVEVFLLLVGKRLALDHLHEQAAQTARLLNGLAGDQVGHHVGGCLRDGRIRGR